jgi:putative DNA methylase
MQTIKKKLIEVALPLDAINTASAREKSIRHGHPSTLHLWWARRPLAAARAVIFAQMVDDPSAHPEHFPTEEAQEAERQRLFRIIEQLVLWENTTNERVLNQAREEIWKSWRRTCADNRDHPQAAELFNPEKLPAFHDPFAGGGALPLEAQRLGLESYASDLNPVPVLINKAMIEIPPKFANQPPVNPRSRSEYGETRKERAASLSGTGGLAEVDGSGAGDLSLDSAAPAGRDVRDAFTDHAGSRVDSGEYRGGMDARVTQREGSIPGDRSGLTGGSGDPSDSLRANRLVSAPGDDASARLDRRSQPYAHDDAPQAEGGTRNEEIGISSEQKGDNDDLRRDAQSSFLPPRSWKGAQGLAEDVRYYGQWMREEAEKRIGYLYPKILVTAEMVEERPDLKQYQNQELTVIAWIWARTVKSPNPAYTHVDVPLASTFMLSTKAGKEAYIEPVIEGDNYRFTVKVGKPNNPEAAKNGTKLARGANFRCLLSEMPIEGDYIKAEGVAGRMGARLMAIVAEGERGRVYLTPTAEHEAIVAQAQPEWEPETPIPNDKRSMFTPLYGLTHFKHIFTRRQLVALNTFADLVTETREKVKVDAIAARLADDNISLNTGGTGAQAYADAIAVYLAFAVDRGAESWCSLARWQSTGDFVAGAYARQALPMMWDYADANPFSFSTRNFLDAIGWVAEVVELLPANIKGYSTQHNAQKTFNNPYLLCKVISTDPPYYDNIGYADLSDYFYVWLRQTLRPVFPELFSTLTVPKAEELVAAPYRHGGKEPAEAFFLTGMSQAMQRLVEQSHSAFPITIYYAFKQSETDAKDGTSSTGWETFLAAVIEAGFAITGTWPVRTEREARSIGLSSNALASSIVLVCRARPQNAPVITRRDFLAALKAELPPALIAMQRGNIAPVDLAQAAIGPGMAVFSRYSKVIDASGNPLSVREALAIINQILDEVLAEQEGDFDADTRWALAWFEQFAFNEGEYGVAETLSKAKNTSINGMIEAGLLNAKSGKVRLLKPEELTADWSPLADTRLTVWETVHHLVRRLEQGEQSAAELLGQLGSRAETARELAYRLYTICERSKRAQEALAYNSLVQSWPEMLKLAQQSSSSSVQTNLFGEE